MEANERDLEFVFHNNVIGRFNDLLYKDVFTKENIKSNKKAIMIEGDKYYGYFLEKNKETFFVYGDAIKLLPFKMGKTTEVDYKGEVFNFSIEEPISINIPKEKKLEFRELIDIMPAFKHSNPKHFLLYKIISTASYIDRLNARFSTEPGFGKDSVVSIMQQLVNSTVNIYGATFAKLEFSLVNKLMVLNEMGNLKSEEKIMMQEFLLAVGAYFNTYTKRTRKTKLTQEQYDISKLSLLIFYNLPKHYIGKAQEYFDQLFTKAVTNRFIPFYFKGTLTTKFETLFDVDEMIETHSQTFKDVIATLNYYRYNNVQKINYEIPKSIKFSEDLNRYERTFMIILKYVGEYSETQEEFNDLSEELFKCYKSYKTLIETTLERGIK